MTVDGPNGLWLMQDEARRDLEKRKGKPKTKAEEKKREKEIYEQALAGSCLMDMI